MSEKLPETMSPREMRELADRLEADAKRQRASADAQEERAKHLRGAADTIEALRAMPVDSGLPFDEQSDTMGTMNTSDIDTRPGIPGRKFTTKHPLPMRAKALKLSIGDIAEQLSTALRRAIPRTSVRSWYAPKGNIAARPIPADAVKYFEADPWNIPRSAWKNGVSE